jgi:hypothetical protein
MIASNLSLSHTYMYMHIILMCHQQGIAPTLISFRVGLGVSAEYTTAAVTTTGISWARPATTRTGYERTNHTYATRPTMTTDYGTTDVEYEDVELAHREKHDSVSKASGGKRSMEEAMSDSSRV